MERKEHIAIGLISGTSVDSIDAAAVKAELLDGHTRIHLMKGISYPIPGCVRNEIFELFEDRAGALHRLSLMNMRLGFLFADAVLELLKESGLRPGEVSVIGSHGQTVYHVALPEESCGLKIRGSLQIGEASVIAQKTGIPVVSDFRAADIAAGGNGAPLVPFLDSILFHDPEKDVALQNLGGIGNVTWIPRDSGPIIAFDTGPGNMIVDMLVDKYTGGEHHFDPEGSIGKKGEVIPELLEAWMKHPFLSQRPPKSTGREEFGTVFFSNYVGGLELTPDLIRTAEDFTARTIAHSYKTFLPRLPETVFVTGGGAHNSAIMGALARYLKPAEVVSGSETGIDVDFKEAMAFALMGLFRWIGRPNNVPEATGAAGKVIMGKLSLP